jgi:hypothetical protein
MSRDITRAIKAAAEAISNRHAKKAGGCWAPSEIPDQGECADANCYCAKRAGRDAAVAIAAFLEALPPRLMLPISQTHVAWIGNQGRLALIAAVREVKP